MALAVECRLDCTRLKLGHRDQLGGTRPRWDGGQIQGVSGNWGWREMGGYVRYIGDIGGE